MSKTGLQAPWKRMCRRVFEQRKKERRPLTCALAQSCTSDLHRAFLQLNATANDASTSKQPAGAILIMHSMASSGIAQYNDRTSQIQHSHLEKMTVIPFETVPCVMPSPSIPCSFSSPAPASHSLNKYLTNP